MNILISVNNNYLDKAKTMIFSLSRNCSEKLNIYLMNKEIDESSIKCFEKFLNRKCNAELICVDVKNLPFDDMPILEYGHFSIEMYYRILAYEVLPENISRILWLDADIVILKDIKDFYYQDFQGHCMVVTPDVKYNSEYILKIKNKIGLPESHKYFNSGVLLLNLDLIRSTCKTKDILAVCGQLKDRLTYPDQDILNYLYTDKVKYMESLYYNYQLYEGMKFNKSEVERAAVLHYTGLEKPWNYKTINKFSKYYWNVLIQRKKYFSFLKLLIISKTRKLVIRIYQKIFVRGD